MMAESAPNYSASTPLFNTGGSGEGPEGPGVGSEGGRKDPEGSGEYPIQGQTKALTSV